MRAQNLHTHTTFCDGKNTPAEMAAAAFAAGLSAIGFSGHSPLEGEEWCMAPADLPAYRAAVEEEKKRYAGRMQVFLGLEQDYFSPPPDGAYDYLIGSVHGLRLDDCLFPVDESPEAFARLADRCGGVRGLLREYYGLLAQTPERTGCDVLGHFDLVTKFNEGGRFFDPEEPALRAPALEALETLAAKDVIFEVNTGAISRDWRTAPYPAPFLLKEMRRKNARVCITGDSHAAGTLLAGFEQAKALLESCGFSSCWYLTEAGFREGPLPEIL